MHNYRNLKVWQRAMDFTAAIYKETQLWPTEEKFGLISQIRRAATSIPLNIAEGSGNQSSKEFGRFLQIALRSTYEVLTAIEIARRLNYLPDSKIELLSGEGNEIAAMLVGLMRHLQKPQSSNQSPEIGM